VTAYISFFDCARRTHQDPFENIRLGLSLKLDPPVFAADAAAKYTIEITHSFMHMTTLI
jgi:hypothetical protein